LGKNLEALRWLSRGEAETFVGADADWEGEVSKGVAETRGMNERGSVELGVRGDIVALVEASSWLCVRSVHD